uniref:GG14429 n=1 Tax=Drosophila erecta TaxID=7220 RepID=B3NYW0_DROER
MPKGYKQKFRHFCLDQPDFKNWLTKDQSDKSKGFCKYCKCSINAKIYQIRAHRETKKHVQNTKCCAQVNKLTFLPIKSDEVCRQETRKHIKCPKRI